MSNSLLKSTQKTYPASLVLNFDDYPFVDSSSYNNTVSNIGDTEVQLISTSKFGAYAALFNGQDNRLDISVGSEFVFGTGDFTIECWFNTTELSEEKVLFSMGDPTDAHGVMVSLIPNIAQSSFPATIKYSIGDGNYSSGTVWAFQRIPPDQVVLDTWHHIAATRHNGVACLYLDGCLIDSAANSIDIDNYNSKFTVGGRSNLGEYFYGKIDGLRVVKGAALYTGTEYIIPNIPPSKYAVISPKLSNHIVITSTKSSGDISGQVTTSTGYYTVNWWDGTKTTYASGENFGKAAVGGSKNITIYPSLSNSTISGNFLAIDVSNNSLTSVRPFHSRFITGPDTAGYYGYYYYQYNSTQGWMRNGWIPAVAGTVYQLDITSNNLDSSALDQLYLDLLKGDGAVNVTDNTGGDSDNSSIATAKGYTVYGSIAPILSALFNFDGTNNSTTFTDSSSYNHVPTRYGNTVISTTQSKFGGASAYFDGTGDYLGIDTNSVFAMGYEDFTVECWAYPTSWPTSDLGAIVENRSSSGSGGFLLWLGSDQKWVLYTSANSNGTQRVVSSVANATLNTWTHLVGIRKNGKLYLYVNGSLVGSTGTEGSPDDLSPSNTSPIRIGTATDNPGTTRMFYGYIDGLKIVKGKALYTDDFVIPSSAPTTSTSIISSGTTRLLLNCNGSNNSTTFTDSSSAARTVTRTNTVISTTQSKFGGASAYFSNSGTDALAVTNNFNLSNTDYTIEFFFYLINLDGMTNNPRLFSIEKSGESWGVLLHNTTPARLTSYNLYGTSTYVDLNSTSISYNTWYHFAMSKDDDTYRFFLDGSLIGSGVGSYTPTGDVVITIGGCRLNYQYNKLNAYMDDFRVVTGKSLYNYNFTPPTSQLAIYP
jgi:hypothetical protein